MKKTILILSQKSDISTNRVIDYLIASQKDFYRVNVDSDRLVDVRLDFEEGEVTKFILYFENKAPLDLNDVYSCWYRRGGIPMFPLPEMKDIYELFKSEKISLKSREHLYAESRELHEYIHWYLETHIEKTIGSQSSAHINKLKQLTVANSCGLPIPETKILTNFKNTSKATLITKSIQDILHAQDDINRYMYFTEDVPADDINDSIQFYPSLFQHKIEKEYEIRIFYLHGTCYSMAIFSQADTKTQTDFRKYNFDRPNRNVPYKLPVDVEEKIVSFMHKINLNCGSLDLIYTKGQYYFLEVNPVGQFGAVSQACSYNLESKIAEYLSN
ncbi:MAG: grasp-with-spasm system ATP-grasp peptide maturase [Chryseobacterium culicis]|uniref:grasp-with-spasm system ATP-grasp peptide maturase n=1 Tax=Chryseobacterium sp. PvR013 TaxID=2806595 RepID=UPI001AE2436B|nr:grasp-with-spasm system ATP-grasp peptide maturase [Chryseobacterium sp. PvR013]MBP1167065.1 ATP-GRASP peptide maturase of grasp-with-spasm system [Chryseobacterium sp. PvR013]